MGGVWRRNAVVALVLWLSCLPAVCRANGVAMVPRHVLLKGQKASQSAQRAAVVWHDGVETLHLKSNYVGPAEGLAWVVPVPARPKVERSSWRVFREAEKATRPQVTVTEMVRGGGFKCGCEAGPAAAGSAPVDVGVTRLESLKIRELHVDVLSAKQGAGLLQWLRDNGYGVPDEALPVFQTYIDKGFYFVAVKIDRDSLRSLLKGADRTVTTGLTPLAITFETPRPFFPLEISKLTAAPETEILILTICPHRMTTAGLVKLGKGDIREALSAQLRRPQSGALDFGPAVRAAQKRGGGKGCFVMESAVTLSYGEPDGEQASAVVWPDGRLPYPLPSSTRTVWVTRFHTFLAPEEMRDVSFTVAGGDAPSGQFQISKDSLQASARVPVGLAVLGLGLLVTPMHRKVRRALRGAGLGLLLFAICIM